tara:strand:+ start:376 stop:681 length:306 start_codon:yes stop_codon:yes gene_type:complete
MKLTKNASGKTVLKMTKAEWQKIGHENRWEELGEDGAKFQHLSAEEKDYSCTLCKCSAVVKLYGFPVCEYHITHGEDAPLCPNCTEEMGPEQAMGFPGNSM